MNYTTNYHLPQWVKSDRIMMDDFNDAMASMENGMTATAAATARAEQSAKMAEDSAAQAAAARPYVVGSYVGTGGGGPVNLGFRPSFLIISGMRGATVINSTATWETSFGMTGGNALKKRLELTDTGFMTYPSGFNSSYGPDFTENGVTYDYIAFK